MDYLQDKLHEECAVFGIGLREAGQAAGTTYNALLAMQHRGQEGAGIAVTKINAIHCHKNVGLVSEVFTNEILQNIPDSNMAIGHNRYSTTGKNVVDNVQPFVTEFLTGRIATAHNGNITNAAKIRSNLEAQGLDFSASSDTEVVSALIAYSALKQKDFLQGLICAAKQIEGAYSMVIMGSNNKLVAIRDPHGFRPLCLGQNDFGIAVASESCALDSCGFEFARDIAPGEVVVIENGKITHSEIALHANKQSLCIFEYVYFARPDSVIDSLSVYEARYNMGCILAKEYPIKADIVCGVPDSGLDAAMGYALQSGLPLVSGFVKNRYIGRSFIYPVQSQRESAVRLKLNPLKANVEGKRIVLIDDSIVRGTTSAQIIKSLRDAGAKEVHMLLSSPPFLHTCYFGIDIGNEENLIANNHSTEAIRQMIDADTLGFISHEGLLKSCAGSQMPFCTGCFTGDYSVDVESISSKTQFENGVR